MTHLITAVGLFVIFVSAAMMMFGPAKNGRPWLIFAADMLGYWLVLWFTLVAAAGGLYWLDLSGFAGLAVFLVLLVLGWALRRFFPKWMSAAVSAIGLASLVAYLAVVLADPKVQASIQKQNEAICAAELTKLERGDKSPFAAGCLH